MSSARYVYAILPRDAHPPAGLTGWGGTPLTTVTWCDLAAMTSAVSPGEPQPTPDNVLRHAAIVERLREVGPILPVRFGTVLRDGDAVKEALAQRYHVLVADLERLGSKIELGLTVLWDPPDVTSEGVASASERHAGSGDGTRYLQARLAEQRREAVLRRNAGKVVRELETALDPHVLEQHSTILPTPRLLLRAAYLVDPARIGSFRDTLGTLRANHPELRFLLSGPWPPYSFVSQPSEADQVHPTRRGRRAEPM